MYLRPTIDALNIEQLCFFKLKLREHYHLELIIVVPTIQNINIYI